MSRVTIYDVVTDGIRNDAYRDVQDIEVVPRKIVEMIIEKCREDFTAPWNNGSIAYEATCIKDYAESLLKQFEEAEDADSD